MFRKLAYIGNPHCYFTVQGMFKHSYQEIIYMLNNRNNFLKTLSLFTYIERTLVLSYYLEYTELFYGTLLKDWMFIQRG